MASTSGASVHRYDTVYIWRPEEGEECIYEEGTGGEGGSGSAWWGVGISACLRKHMRINSVYQFTSMKTNVGGVGWNGLGVNVTLLNINTFWLNTLRAL